MNVTTLSDYPDDAVLTTRQVAAWLGIQPKAVLRLPLAAVPLYTRERRFLAGDVKALMTAKAARRLVPLKKAS